MSKITKVLFDNDGVNGDSEHIAVDDAVTFIVELLRNHGGIDAKNITYQDIALRIKGNSSDIVLRDIINEFNIPEDALREAYNVPKNENVVEYLSNQHTLRVIEAFRGGQLFVFPGFNEAMDELVSHYGAKNIGLCTASRADRMDATEDALDPETGENANWGRYFPEGRLRFSGHNCPNKYKSFFDANPDWAPEETICVEDSAGSVKKALDAGAAAVIGCAYSSFQVLDDDGNFSEEKQRAEIAKLKEAGASVIVRDYRDIPTAAKWIENGMKMDDPVIHQFRAPITHNNPLEADRRVVDAAPGAYGPN